MASVYDAAELKKLNHMKEVAFWRLRWDNFYLYTHKGPVWAVAQKDFAVHHKKHVGVGTQKHGCTVNSHIIDCNKAFYEDT